MGWLPDCATVVDSSVCGDSLAIAVLTGGVSAERDISIASAVQVVEALRCRGQRVRVVDTAQGWLTPSQEKELLAQRVGTRHSGERTLSRGIPSWLTLPEDFFPDLWFLALHGGAGEDGRMQGLLEMTGIPYTGSGVLGSALAMDKDVSKRLLREAGVPTPDWLMAPVAPDEIEGVLGWPVVVKPSKQGSTVGLSVVYTPEELPGALALAFQHDDEVMVERFVPGRELTGPVLGSQALTVGEIVLQKGNIFDYEAKYQPGGAREVFPADLSPAKTTEVQRLSLLAHRTLKLQGYSRSDFRLDAEGRLWCLEVNTLPGLTAMSLVPQAAAAQGISFGSLVDQLCRQALSRASMTRSAPSKPV
ncbi:MAG: D-alanine--D-alanine ligase [Ferrovum sp.]|jgi:D-alanine-D-alanine ligase|nr:D-alanine--D-alanine ligase [Ferrovum sp.]NDU89630.1 D-alanine--D-alanine ligase [Ferrovum sp.]